jgi:hypothetical protein
MSYLHITNIDTLSALLDRLISENIKLHFFLKDGVDDNIEHQEKVIIVTIMYLKKEHINQMIS